MEYRYTSLLQIYIYVLRIELGHVNLSGIRTYILHMIASKLFQTFFLIYELFYIVNHISLQEHR